MIDKADIKVVVLTILIFGGLGFLFSQMVDDNSWKGGSIGGAIGFLIAYFWGKRSKDSAS